MKYESTSLSSSSLSSSCTSEGEAMAVSHPNHIGLASTVRKAKTSSELELNSSTDEDGSTSSLSCNTASSFLREKPHKTAKKESEQLPILSEKDSASINVASKTDSAGSCGRKAGGLVSRQAEHEEEEKVKQMEEEATIKKIGPELSASSNIPLLKSNSVSATKADDILSLDLITASSSSYHGHYHSKLQGHRLSTGDSPLNMQKRHGPASLRTGLPSPGTPSRSSFSGVPSSFMLNKAYYNNMVGRIAVNEGNGKLLPLHNVPPCCQDQDAAHANGLQLNPGRLSLGFPLAVAARAAAPPPSKWEDAHKWLANASPSPAPTSKNSANLNLKQASNINPLVECKRMQKRSLYDASAAVSSPSCASQYYLQMADDSIHCRGEQLAQSNTHTSKNHHLDSAAAAAAMAEHYIQSRFLFPIAAASSSRRDREARLDGGAVSDSELSNTQEECRSAFVRSSSHRQSTDGKHHSKMRKEQALGRKGAHEVSKEELVIPSPVSLQLERLKLGSSASQLSDQLPKMHDVYAVETAKRAGASADVAPGEEAAAAAADVAGSSRVTRLVVQAGKVVGKWGAGAMRDASTDVSPKTSMSRRDMGTQMTPVASCKTSRCATPRKQQPCGDATSEATSDHSRAEAASADSRHGAEAGRGHVGSTLGAESCSSWKSLQEGLLSASDHHRLRLPAHGQLQKLSSAEMELAQSKPHDSPQCSAWEKAERSKHMTKCAREEARIDAWENHQKAKAEAELKKLEMKLERLRAQTSEKIMNKVATAHLRAEEMRATARAQQADQLAKALERANNLNRKNGGSLSESLGACFSIMP